MEVKAVSRQLSPAVEEVPVGALSWALVERFGGQNAAGTQGNTLHAGGLWTWSRAGLQRWDLTSGRSSPYSIPGELSGPVQCMASDGRLMWFGCGGTGGTIIAFQPIEDGLNRRQELAGHSGGVSCLLHCQHQGRPVMLSAGADFQVKLWSSEGKLLRTSAHHHASVEALATAPSNASTNMVWTGSSDGTLFAVPISSEPSGPAEAPLARRIKATAVAGITCIVPVGSLMWVGRANGSISVFNPGSEAMLSEVTSRSARISCMGVVGQHVWVGYADRHITVHDAKTADFLYSVGDQGGFLKSLQVNGWNIWAINSTGIRVYADEGQQLQAQAIMQEQQSHLRDAAALAATLRSKISEMDGQIKDMQAALEKLHQQAAEAQDVGSSPHNSSPSPELEGLSSDHGAVRQSGQLAAAASSASITANWSPGDEAEGGEDADAATLVQNEGPVFDDERLTGLGTGSASDDEETAWMAALEAALDELMASVAGIRSATAAQLQELRAAALEMVQQQMRGVQGLQKSLAECLQDRYEMQVACRALQKQALQEAGQVSKIRQLELGVQQAALDHHRLERELASLLQELNQGPLPQLNDALGKADEAVQTDDFAAAAEQHSGGLPSQEPSSPRHLHRPGWRHEYLVEHGRIIDSPQDGSEADAENEGSLSNLQQQQQQNSHKGSQADGRVQAAKDIVTRSLPSALPRPPSMPAKPFTRRPSVLRTLSTGDGQSAGLIRAHMGRDTSEETDDEISQTNRNLPVLYASAEPIRYIPPTGFL
ncbi:hypothetical protein WJX84_002565 [Apatococcus fuscideae]|uniref:Uncharacterized protein n=1 Tax=Apatococcus fuscideae TaxID=2026836 RepID=A0AAW1TFP0_9CHLO